MHDRLAKQFQSARKPYNISWVDSAKNVRSGKRIWREPKLDVIERYFIQSLNLFAWKIDCLKWLSDKFKRDLAYVHGEMMIFIAEQQLVTKLLTVAYKNALTYLCATPDAAHNPKLHQCQWIFMKVYSKNRRANHANKIIMAQFIFNKQRQVHTNRDDRYIKP